MKVIEFILRLIDEADNKAKIRTKGYSNFEFVTNPKEPSSADTDTVIAFDNGVTVEDFIKYVATHNIENYAMFTSSHRNFGNYSSDDIDIRKDEVVVK